MFKDKLCIVLFGAPGSGKSTIGRKLSEEIGDSIFVSVGSVMREELGMTPPYINSNRYDVMNYINNKYTQSNKSILIIDCNPFPEEMWKAFIQTTLSLRKIYVHIKAPDEILIKRMQDRGRIDSNNFTYEQRLDYFHKNVDSKIKDITEKDKENIITFDNLYENDIAKIANDIKLILNN